MYEDFTKWTDVDVKDDHVRIIFRVKKFKEEFKEAVERFGKEKQV